LTQEFQEWNGSQIMLRGTIRLSRVRACFKGKNWSFLTRPLPKVFAHGALSGWSSKQGPENPINNQYNLLIQTVWRDPGCVGKPGFNAFQRAQERAKRCSTQGRVTGWLCQQSRLLTDFGHTESVHRPFPAQVQAAHP
jgi:hypothetical protein